MQNPLVPPENRPSVIKATVSPNPCPYIAPVVESISRIPGPPLGPSYLIITASPALISFFKTAVKASSSESKHLAFPLKVKFFKPAIFDIHPSGARLPHNPTTELFSLIGLSHL